MSFEPWREVAADTPLRVRDRCYGVDRAVLGRMRMRAQLAAESRGTMADHMEPVRAYLADRGETTARQLSEDLGLWLADARNAIGQLMAFGELERDGEIPEGSDGRWVARYVWTGP